MSFLCPRDHAELITLRERGKVCHQCPTCHGYIVTIALLRRLVSREFANALWNDARNGASRQGPSCPGCRHPMHAVEVSRGEGRDPVELDVCLRCQHVWLDEGEIEAAPERIEKNAKPEKVQLSEEAAEALGRMQLQSLAERRQFEYPDDRLDEWWHYIPWILGFPVASGGSLRTRPGDFAWGTILIAIAVASISASVFLWVPEEAHHELFLAWGFVPDLWARASGITFLTAFFLHASWGHLLGNLYFLLLASFDAEGRLGMLKYITLLCAATIVGNVAHLLWEPQSAVPAIGASGGISGILAYWALAFPTKKLNFFCWFGLYRSARSSRSSLNLSIPVPAALVLWLGYQSIVAWQQLEGFGSVSGLAHLGGAACGIAGYLLEKRWRAGRVREPEFSE